MGITGEKTLTELIYYNNWANRQVIDACRELEDELLDRPIAGCFGSIRSTLNHIVRSEAWYVKLMRGTTLEPPFTSEDHPTMSEIAAYAEGVTEVVMAAAEEVDLFHRIEEEYEGEPLIYNALLVFIQLINHGIEHRTNITTVLNQEGLEPPDVDGWGFLLAHRGQYLLHGEAGQYQPVWEDTGDSTMITAYKYNPESEELMVVFNKTGIYRYAGVPAEVIQALREAPSKGRFLRSEIIDVYPFEKGR